MITRERIDTVDEKEICTVEFVCELLDVANDADRSEMIARATIRAKELRCKGLFSKILKEQQKEEQKQRELENSQHQCTFTGRDVDLKTGIWQANDHGIVAYTDKGKLEACPHPIYPVCLLNNVQTGKEKIRLAWKKGLKWREITVEKSVVASQMKIVSLADNGIAVTTDSSKALVKYLADIENLNLGDIEILNSTSKLGWINGQFIPYHLGIEIDSENNFKDVLDSIRTEGSREVWYDLVRDIRSTKRFEPRIYIAAALASILLEPLNALPFIVNLWGETGKGKTVALNLATSVFADPAGGYMSDSKSTATAFEARNNFLNNLPVMIDDLSQLKSRYDDDFSSLIYTLCSGHGKSRSNTSLGLNTPTSWTCAILTNNEHSIIRENMQGGAANRVIDVEMEDGYVFSSGNYVVETLRSNYGFLGQEFIQLLDDEGLKEIKELQKDFEDKLKKKAKAENENKEEKQITPMSIILTVDKIIEERFFKDGILLDFDQCYDLLKDQNDIDENVRTYEEIINRVAQNQNSFIDDQYVSGRSNEDWITKILGKIVKKDNLAIIEKKTFDTWCKESNNTSNSFLRWAEKNDLLYDHAPKRLTKLCRLNSDIPMWCVWLKYPSKNNENDGFRNVKDIQDLVNMPIEIEEE